MRARAVRARARDRWTGSPPHLYLHHGRTGLERHSLEAALRLERAGTALSLDAALDRPDADELDYMVEVKRGHGDRRAAISACVQAFARRGLQDRLLLAASSLPVVEEVRRDHAGVKVALFVSHIFRDGGALHLPKLEVWRGLRRGAVLGPATLAGVDVVACVNPFAAGRGCQRAQTPIARSVEDARRLAAAGMYGAFAYFDPCPLG